MKQRSRFPEPPKEPKVVKDLEERLSCLTGIKALEVSLPRSPGMDAVKELESRLALLGKSDPVSHLEDRLTLLREVAHDDFEAQLDRMREAEPERARAVEIKIDLLRAQEEAIRKTIKAIQQAKDKEKTRLITGEAPTNTSRERVRPSSSGTHRRGRRRKTVFPKPPGGDVQRLEARLARLKDSGDPETFLERRFLALQSPDSPDPTMAAYAQLHQGTVAR